MRATPATPPASAQFPDQLVRSNHVVYARRVLEAAARSMVAVAGSRIQEAAELSREYPDLGPGALAATLAHTQQRLAVLGERLRHAQGSPGSLITAALGGPVPDTLPADVPELVTGGIQSGPGAPPLTTRAVIEAEREVLTACLTDPATRAALLGWLTPQDFCRPEHAATWAAYGALTKAGTPIDYVTLARECERHHPDHDSPGLPADQLATMARHTPGLPGPAVRTVAHAALLRHTDAAREHVAAIADDRTRRRADRGLRGRRRLPRRRTPRPPALRHHHRGKPGQRRAQLHHHHHRVQTTSLDRPTTTATTTRLTTPARPHPRPVRRDTGDLAGSAHRDHPVLSPRLGRGVEPEFPGLRVIVGDLSHGS